MSRLLAAIFLLLSAAAARAACPLTGPQNVPSPYVWSGIDGNCIATFRQLGTNELTSPYPFSTSTTTTTLGYGQMVLGLDNWTGFATGMIVQVTYQADPTQYIIGAITAFSSSTGAATINIIVPNPSNVIAAGFNVQVLGGSPINGVPVWAGLSIDGTDSITNPSVSGQYVNMTIEPGKAFTNGSNVYVWSPQDITTWFTGTVTSDNNSTGAITIFVRQTANTGLSYSTNYISLIDLAGPDAALSGYSGTPIGMASVIMPTFLPGAFNVASAPSVGSTTAFTTQAGQFFPLNGQMLASCITPGSSVQRIAGQVQAYNGTNLILKDTALYGSIACASWALYLDTGPTTRISRYQMNGLQITNNPSPQNLVINAGSVRDSTDTIDLVYGGGTINYSGGGSQFVSVAGPGTINAPSTAVTGTGTSFTTTFSATATLTDLSNQLAALNLTAVSFPSVISVPPVSDATASTTAITDSTHLTTNGSMSVTSSSYTRGGLGNLAAAVVYGILLAYHTSDGAVAAFATSFTPSGAPDLPAGYSFYRVIGYVAISADNVVNTIAQPLVTNVLTTVGDIPYFGSATSPGGATYQDYLQRLPIGSTSQFLDVTGGLPAWVTMSGDCTLSGGAITCTKTNGTAFGALATLGKGASLEASPGNPTGNSSTTAKMMGLGSTCAITPASTGNLTITFDGFYSNSATTKSLIQMYYGTGIAPSNAATLTGTSVGPQVSYSNAASASNFAFSLTRTITGQAVGTALWLDLSVATGTGTDTASVGSINCSAKEGFLEHPIPANDNDLTERVVA